MSGTHIETKFENNVGNVIGKIVANFSPNVTVNFNIGSSNAKKEIKSIIQTDIVDSDKNEILSNRSDLKKKITHNDEVYEVIMPCKDGVYRFELSSGRDIELAISQSISSKDIASSRKITSANRQRPGSPEIPDAYQVIADFEECFTLPGKILFPDKKAAPTSADIPVVLIEFLHPQRGSEKFVLLPSDISRTASAAAVERRARTKSPKRTESPKSSENKEAPSREDLSIVIETKMNDGTTERRNFFLDWPLERLGEGSYGVVFAGRNSDLERVAVKVLYTRQFSTGTGQIAIDVAEYKRLMEGFGRQKNGSKKITPGSNLEYLTPVTLVDSLITGIIKRAEKGDSLNARELIEIRSEAQKLIRQSVIGSDLAEMRFNEESTIDKYIRVQIENQDIVPATNKYVGVQAYTNKFRASNAFMTVDRLSHDRGTANYSDYAIIMNFCQETLKDLLEREYYVKRDNNEIIELSVERKSDDSLENYEKILGYDILDALSMAERAENALPFLEGVADGLVEIHLAGRMHHDIKPGNTFVHPDGEKMAVLLGDFSFVGSVNEPGSNEATLRDAIGVGEMHYRSPEQNDFMEVMQAEIKHGSPEYADDIRNSENYDEVVQKAVSDDKCFYLRVRDPKFRKSLIIGGDKFVINSDQSGTVYEISCVIPRESSWDIWPAIQDYGHMRELFRPAKRVQVTFFKMPTRKTDLYGLGGLAFELLTAGDSPSRFYEKLRAIDQIGNDASVDDLIEDYRAFIGVGSDREMNPAIRNVLAVFSNRKGEYAPEWIVEFILRCMVFNLEGAYSKAGQDESISRRKRGGGAVFVEVMAAAAFIRGKMRDCGVTSNVRNILYSPTDYYQNKTVESRGDDGENTEGEGVITSIRRAIGV